MGLHGYRSGSEIPDTFLFRTVNIQVRILRRHTRFKKFLVLVIVTVIQDIGGNVLEVGYGIFRGDGHRISAVSVTLHADIEFVGEYLKAPAYPLYLLINSRGNVLILLILCIETHPEDIRILHGLLSVGRNPVGLLYLEHSTVSAVLDLLHIPEFGILRLSRISHIVIVLLRFHTVRDVIMPVPNIVVGVIVPVVDSDIRRNKVILRHESPVIRGYDLEYHGHTLSVLGERRNTDTEMLTVPDRLGKREGHEGLVSGIKDSPGIDIEKTVRWEVHHILP